LKKGLILFFSERELSPYVNRIRMYWADMRGIVLKNFPQAPSVRQSTEEYLRYVDEIYPTDAYHSLSIEGYRVSEQLIERVRSGNWDPETNRKDKAYADALAAIQMKLAKRHGMIYCHTGGD
jgi:hypothetical protein